MTAAAPLAGVEPAYRLTDSTLRDGSHAFAHRYTPEQVTGIARALDEAGVPPAVGRVMDSCAKAGGTPALLLISNFSVMPSTVE